MDRSESLIYKLLKKVTEPNTIVEKAKGVFLVPLIALVFFYAFNINAVAQTTKNKTMSSNTELATFGAGCFWCVEAIFSRVDGVLDVQSGYSGGLAPPTGSVVAVLPW